ncbi:PAS domain-containing protein [Muricoccus nepalensis]|uniref:PAS domain-containing protein n=1 Tax=Muricoccus nepalensis TaxID=1854500 RepID=UPI0011262620|nr:PAS domain-containing protein [Roseomonas nepalensis]
MVLKDIVARRRADPPGPCPETAPAGSARSGFHAPAWPRRSPTLRRRVLVFALGAALPLLVLAGGAVWQQNRAERLRAEEGLVARAHAMALLLDREFAGAERLLAALAGSPSLARGDLPTFWSEMRSAGLAYGARAVNLIGPDGRIRLSTSWLPGERPDVLSIGPAAEALATGRSVVGNLFVSPSVGEWSVGVAVPIMAPGPAGAPPIRHVLGLIVPRERLLSTLTDQRMPPGAVAAALDRQLTIVARTARDRETLATKPPAEVLAAIGPPAGTIPPFTATEGERVHAAYALAPQSGYWVKVTVPAVAFEASLRQALLPTLLIGSGLLTVTLVFGVLFADRLTRSLRRLGDPGLAGAPAGAAVREIDELGALLARRAEAREAAAAEARALFDASPVGVVRSDAGGRVTAANDAFLCIVGMTREDLAAGRIRWDDLTPPEWIGRDEAAIAEAARNGACAPYQKEYVRPDGTRVPVLMFFAFHNRTVGAASAFVVDLSGWEATEAALAHAHERMHLAMGAARIFSWDWNVVTGAVQWSGGLEAALGMSEASFGGTVDDFRALVHEDDLPRVEAALRAALADEAPYDIEFRMRRADGGERWVVTRGTVLRDGTGRPTRMIGIDFDITDRKRAELALAESKAALRRITEAGRIATFEVEDPGTGGEARVSPGFRALYGLPPDARCDFATVLDRVHPEDRDAFLVDHRRLAAEGGRFVAEFRVLLSGGGTRWIQSMGEGDPGPGPGGMPARLRGVAFDITARKQAERPRAARPDDLVETLDLGTFMARDLDGTIRYWSGGCERLYGWTAAEAVGRSSHELLGTAFPVPLAAIEAALESDGAWSGDLRHRTRDGREVLVAAHKALRRNADGTPALVLEALVDVTAQRVAERALRESEATLSAVLDALPVGVIIADAKGRILRDNLANRELWGIPPETTGWEAYADWAGWWPETGERIRAEEWAMARALLRGETVRDEMVECARFGSGERRFYLNNAAPIRDAGGQVIGGVVAELDVTERRAAELGLRESEERLRLAQDAAAIGIWEWDVASGAQRWSDREFTLHGLDPATATASMEAWRAAVHPDDRDRAEGELARVLREGGELRTDYRVVLPGGGVRWLVGRGIVLPARGGAGSARGGAGSARGGAGSARGAAGRRVIGVNIDVTEGKNAEAALARANAELEARVAERTRALSEAAEELQAEMRRREQTQLALAQAQKLEALGQLTGSVAHDFNNVLAAVMGSLRLIERRAHGNEGILALARGGGQAAERAAALIRQLMAFARREDLTPVVVGPARVLEEVDEMLRRSVGSGIALSLRADPTAWPVLTDPHRLEIALLNLAVNARDAMEGVGSLAVEARNAPPAPGAARPEGLDPKQDYVVVSVQDSGPGMPPEVLARASEPFFTTKPRGQGTGLGLAMVHGFARQSGGVLRLRSAPGEGTTAEIWLPRAAGEAAVAAAAVEVEPNPALHGSATVLVVDDDDQVRLVTATQLRDLGYEVIEAGGLASAMVQASAAASLDLVVTDITMPGGRGPDLALRLRASRPGIPILFVSGYGDPASPPSEVILAKPFTPAELSRRVLAALGRLPTPLHERMLMRLSRPELRQTYLAWRALRDAAGGGEGLPTPDAFDGAGIGGGDHAFTVALERAEGGEPRLRFVRVGTALERRLGRPLVGQEAGGELDGDEVFGGLDDAYRRCARLGVPCHDYARFGFGDGGEPLYFERLLLPLADDGGTRPTHLVGLAFFSDPA